MSAAPRRHEEFLIKPDPPEEKAELLAAPKPGPTSITPMELIQVAVNQNADIDKLEKLLGLQLRWEANEARKAYVVAMNAFKANAPKILKNKHVEFGQTKYDHATLDAACDALIPALSEHGLSHRWRIEQPDGKVRVSCIITHEMGHSEETTMEGPPDTSGSKNAVQAISSTTSYLERYTFLAATGTAAKGMDNDGRGAEVLAGIDDMLRAIGEAPDTSALTSVYKGATQKAMLAKNGPAIITLTAARDKRKKELEAQ